MAEITLVYRLPLPPNVSEAVAVAKMAAADVFVGELELLNMTVGPDNTARVGSEIIRTIVLLTNAVSDLLFPNDADKISATVTLYRQSLVLKIPGQVTSDVPVVT